MKLLGIECCDECRYSRTTYEEGYSNLCEIENKKVEEDVDFPDWCPLPDQVSETVS